MDNFEIINNLKNQKFVNTIQPPSAIAVDLLRKFKIPRSDTKFADYNLKEEDPINKEKNLGRPWPPNGIKNIKPSFSETINDLTENSYQKFIKTYVSIESQLRDTSYYPYPYQFAMYLNKKFNNIVKISVLNISQKTPNLFNYPKDEKMSWYIYQPSFVPDLVVDPYFDVSGNQKFYQVVPEVGTYIYEKFGEELFNAMNQFNVEAEDSYINVISPPSKAYTVGAYQITTNDITLSDLYLIGRYELFNFGLNNTLFFRTNQGSNEIQVVVDSNFMAKLMMNTNLPLIMTGLQGSIGGIPLNLLNQTLFHAVDYGDKKANMVINAPSNILKLYIYNEKGDPVNAYILETIYGDYPQLINSQYGRGLPFSIDFSGNNSDYLKNLGFPISNKFNTVPKDGLNYKFIHSSNDYKLDGDAIYTDTITFGFQTIGNSVVPYLIPQPIFFLKLTFPNGAILENFVVATGYQNIDLEGYKTTSVPSKITNTNQDFSNIFCKCRVNTTPGSFGNIDIINAERIYYNSYVNDVDAILVEFISLENTLNTELGEVSLLLEITEVIPVLKETLINTRSNEIITAGKDINL